MQSDRRSNDIEKTVLVLGGNGFIGRHIVSALRAQTTRVLVGTRKRTAETGQDSNQRYFPLHLESSAEDWQNALRDVDVVINAVGILRQRRGESYAQVHHLAVERLANLCGENNIRFVHVSIMGIDSPAKSRFVTSKQCGERAVRDSNADWYIVRPSLVDGEGGFGAKWFRRVAAWPVQFAPANAAGKFAPIDAQDLGEAIANIALSTIPPRTEKERIYELGGNHILSIAEFLRCLSPDARHRPLVKVPAWCARLVSHVCDAVHRTPFSFGHYELLQYRNYPEHNRLQEVLGRAGCDVPREKRLNLISHQSPKTELLVQRSFALKRPR